MIRPLKKPKIDEKELMRMLKKMDDDETAELGEEADVDRMKGLGSAPLLK